MMPGARDKSELPRLFTLRNLTANEQTTFSTLERALAAVPLMTRAEQDWEIVEQVDGEEPVASGRGPLPR